MAIHKKGELLDNAGRKVIGFFGWYYNTVFRKPYKKIKDFLSYEYTP